jgi:hypothetical protein
MDAIAAELLRLLVGAIARGRPLSEVELRAVGVPYRFAGELAAEATSITSAEAAAALADRFSIRLARAIDALAA